MQVMEKTWKDTPENMQIKETGNLRALFVRSLLYHHYHLSQPLYSPPLQAQGARHQDRDLHL